MKKIRLFSISLAIAFLCLGCKTNQGKGKTQQAPNVVIVITDDQGYGDLAFTGNPAIKTPTIDELRKQGTLLNNFHVDPTCAPTRSALKRLFIQTVANQIIIN